MSSIRRPVQQKITVASPSYSRCLRTRYRKVRVWYNQDASQKDSGRCLTLTLQWIEEMALSDAPLAGSEDQRLLGFKEIKK